MLEKTLGLAVCKPGSNRAKRRALGPRRRESEQIFSKKLCVPSFCPIASDATNSLSR